MGVRQMSHLHNHNRPSTGSKISSIIVRVALDGGDDGFRWCLNDPGGENPFVCLRAFKMHRFFADRTGNSTDKCGFVCFVKKVSYNGAKKQQNALII